MTAPIRADEVPSKKGETVYPEPFNRVVKGRSKRKLGDLFGLTNFGVNLTELDPGSSSALAHYHSKQDEFIFVLQGTATMIIAEQEFILNEGDCIGFKAGSEIAHQLVNRSNAQVKYLEVGDRSPKDEVTYPNDDLSVRLSDTGNWVFSRKDGTGL